MNKNLLLSWSIRIVIVVASIPLCAQNVGINNPSPTARLHVVEPTNGIRGFRIDKSNSQDGLFINLNNTSGGIGNGIELNFNSNTTGSSAFWLKNYGDLAALNIDNYGDAMGLQVWSHNLSSTKSTFVVHNESAGKAIYVDASNTNSDTLAYLFQSGTGMGAYVYSNGPGMRVVGGGTNNYGIFSLSQDFMGVYGFSNSTASYSGIYGRAVGFSGVTGSTGAGSTYAVFGYGDYGGTGAKYFVIDHPTDPANKMLKHFCIESDEPMLIYRGKAEFDANGEVLVLLKDYVQAINTEYTYNLTPIGQYMPLYIAEEVNESGAFKIAGGTPGAKVAWTAYGQRNDAYFKANPEKLNPEIEKPAFMRGKYLDPLAHGLPRSMGVDYNPQIDGEGKTIKDSPQRVLIQEKEPK